MNFSGAKSCWGERQGLRQSQDDRKRTRQSERSVTPALASPRESPGAGSVAHLVLRSVHCKQAIEDGSGRR